MLFNNHKINLLERSLDAATLRQKVAANNVANVDTPNFKRSYVRFEEFLSKEMKDGMKPLQAHRTNTKHLEFSNSSSSMEAQVMTDEHSKINNNNNNVDIDYEMSLMAKNQLRYNLITERTSSYFKSMRQAIDGR